MNRCRWLRSDGLCACRPQARLIAEGLGRGEIAEKEAMGASRKTPEGRDSDLSGGAPWPCCPLASRAVQRSIPLTEEVESARQHVR